MGKKNQPQAAAAKTLGQVAYEAFFKDDGTARPWGAVLRLPAETADWERAAAAVINAAAARTPAQPVAAGLSAGIELAARWVERRAEAYDHEHGSTDPDTGSREYPGTGEEYVGELLEIAEGIRALNEPGQPAAVVDDLATLVTRLVRALHKAAPGNDLCEKATGYLKRHGLSPSPFRAAPQAAPAAAGGQ